MLSELGANHFGISALLIVGGYIIALVLLALCLHRSAWYHALAKLVHLVFFLLALELVKLVSNPTPELLKWIHGLQLALLAYLTIHLVVNLYIGIYLEHRRHVSINLIVRDLIKFLLIAVFALVFLRYVLGLNLVTILTPSAILTAIIGLSMQDTIGNFIAGILIHVEKPFEINDFIAVSGHEGYVREINWRYTKVETIDHLYVLIPNNKISSDKIVNFSKPTPRVKQFLSIGVSYDTPPLKVKRAIMEILHSNANIIERENAEVVLDAYGDSSINYKIVYTIGDIALRRQIQDEVYSAIWYQFQKHGIEIPYPIRSVIMKPPPAAPDISEVIVVIGALPFFEGVHPENISRLIRFGLMHTVHPGHVAVKEGEAGSSMFFIIDGKFKVTKAGTVINRLHKGDFFGEMSLLADENRSATVEAESDGKTLEIDRSAFKTLVETEPIMIKKIEQVFLERVRIQRAGVDRGDDRERLKESFFSRFKRLFGLA